MALQEGGAISATSLPTAVVSDAADNTYNTAYTELIASTSGETYRVHITVTNIGSENCRFKLALGAASSEVDFVEFHPHWGRSPSNIKYFSFLSTIPDGSRLSANCMIQNNGPGTIFMQVFLSDDDSLGTSAENELWNNGNTGANPPDLDPGTTANTKPTSFTQLIGSSGIDANQLMVCVGVSDNSSISPVGSHLIDIAVGAASSEVVIIPNAYKEHDSGETGNWFMLFDVDTIASGSRISARCQSTYTTESDRLIDCAITAFNVVAPVSGDDGFLIWHQQNQERENTLLRM